MLAQMDYLNRVYSVYQKNTMALTNYSPKPYEGKLTLLRAMNNFELQEKDDPGWQIGMKGFKSDENIEKLIAELTNNKTLGWDKYCDRIEVRDIPGNHSTMLRPPHVKVLAEKIKQYCC